MHAPIVQRCQIDLLGEMMKRGRTDTTQCVSTLFRSQSYLNYLDHLKHLSLPSRVLIPAQHYCIAEATSCVIRMIDALQENPGTGLWGSAITTSFAQIRTLLPDKLLSTSCNNDKVGTRETHSPVFTNLSTAIMFAKILTLLYVTGTPQARVRSLAAVFCTLRSYQAGLQ